MYSQPPQAGIFILPTGVRQNTFMLLDRRQTAIHRDAILKPVRPHYQDTSLLNLEKGMCHVNKYIHRSKSNPDPPHAPGRSDRPLGHRSDCWFCLDADSPRHRTAGFEAVGCVLEIFHLPLPGFSRSVEFLMFRIHTVPNGELHE